jgi:plastocyanin
VNGTNEWIVPSKQNYKKGELLMNKKSLSIILSLVVFFSIGIVSISAAGPQKADMKVLLNGKNLSIAKSAVIVNNRLLLPYRAIAEELGATVSYDATNKSVTEAKGNNTNVLTLGSKIVAINGVKNSLDVPAQLVNNSTYVPVRFLSENLGIQVEYDGATRTVSLNTNSSPAFKVIGVNEGDILYSNQVKLSVAAFNHELVDFRSNMEAKDGQGHVHIWLDTDPTNPKVAYKLTKGEPVVFDNVAPGDHTLTVQLVGNNHKPVAPEVKQVIKFRTAKTPIINVDGVKDGDIIMGSKVTINTDVTDFMLSDFRTKNDVAAGEGHVHIWLDTDVTNPKVAYKQVENEPVTFDNIKPGNHTLTLQLVGANHKPIQPEVKQVIHFKTEAAQKSYDVSIKDFAYSSQTLTIPKGSKVTFTNKDTIEHTVTAKDGSFNTGLFGKGESKTITFSEAGEFQIYCKPHPFMKAKIIVQ